MNEKQIDALGAITRSSDHLKNLIDDVLNLARIESGKELPEPKAISAKDLLTQACKLMQQTAMSKTISLHPPEFLDGAESLSLYCDPKHIHQIVINLMSNAVKYTPNGGQVYIRAEKVSDKLRISIQDTGVGISQEKMKKLFERFERGEDSYSKSQVGTGIGLNLTRHLVDINGGGIGVESEQGKGSTFWILMPLANKETEIVVLATPEKTITRLDGLSVLVVDDNRDTLEVLEQILLSSGARVTIAESVRQGLEHFDKELPDIVLTDLAIPGESGLVLIENIRKRVGESGAVPIMVLSACAFESDRLAALDAGASFFLAKPFRPQEVLQNVRNLTLQAALGEENSHSPLSGMISSTFLFKGTADEPDSGASST